MSDIRKRLEELNKQEQALSIEKLALESFAKMGRFILAIPGYNRILYEPKTESEAKRDAANAARLATNTEPVPLRFDLPTK